MNREELPQEASREDKMRDALKHYEELATKACWHRSDIPDAIRAYYASLPPAEGAEEILLRQRNGEDKPITYAVGKGGWVYKMILRAMTEFATLHAQRIADKMVEANQFILDIAGVLGIETDGVGFDGITLSIDDFKEAADKMVSERLREALTDWADYWNKLETGHACIMKEDIDE